MAERDFKTVLSVLVVAITKAFETMNLSRPMNPEQIVELAETIIESSGEDYLALEDVVLFLQGLTRGKYGQLYESMDIVKFMNLFEIYRNERHKALMDHRDEEHSQYKSIGDSNRWFDRNTEKDEMRTAMAEYLRRSADTGTK